MKFRIDSLPVLALLVIAATVALLVFLIPDRNRVLERALKDKDFSRIEKILSAPNGGREAAKPELRALLEAWLDLNKTVSALQGGVLDAASVQRLAQPFLPLLGDKLVSGSALEGLAETLAHSGSPEVVEKISGGLAIPEGQRAELWRMVESSAKRAGNPSAEACAVQALSDGRPQTVLRIAGLWRRANRPGEAIAALKSWFDTHPHPADAGPLASFYVEILRQENRNSEALDFLLAHRIEIESGVSGSDVMAMIARTSLASGRSAAALPVLHEWLLSHPDNAEIWLLLSDMAMGAGDQGLAARALDNYLRLHPDDAARKFALAKVLEWNGQPGKAMDAYLPLAAEGSRPALDRLLALAYGLHREADLARVLPKFLPESGTSPELLTLASLLVLEGDYDGARKLYLRHLAAEPEDIDPIKRLAEIDMEEQLFDKARELFLRAQKLAPTDTEIEHHLVRLDWLAGRYDGMVDRLRKLAVQTKDPGIIEEFYSAAVSLGDIPALIEAMELKIANDPATPAENYQVLAYYNALLGRANEAKNALARGREQFPRSAYFRQELAYRLVAEGNYPAALKELGGAINAASPKELKSLYAFLLANSGRPKDALKFLQESLSGAEKNDPEILALTGNLFEAEGRFREAAAVYREAVRLAPGNPEFQMSLARTLGGQGRTREMQAVLARIDLSRHPGATRDAAQVYLDIEHYREASALLRRHLAGAGGSGDSLAWRMLGDATLSSGDPERAKRAYRRALQLALKEPQTP